MLAGATGDHGDVGKSARNRRLRLVQGDLHGMQAFEGLHYGIGHLAGDGLDKVAGGAFDDFGGDVGKLGVIDGFGQIIGGGGLGDFAIVYGYRAFDLEVTYVATFIIIIIVQIAQLFGNWLSKKVMRR